MPFFTRQVTTEHDALAAFAAQQIRQVATTLQGLDAEQLRRTPASSQMSLGGIARHCLFVGNEGIFASLGYGPLRIDALRTPTPNPSPNTPRAPPSNFFGGYAGCYP